MTLLINVLLFILLLSASCSNARSGEIHVAKTGSDSNAGTVSDPYLTISKAAGMAAPGDVIIIHEGTYREYVNPPVGGTSGANRITFKAADGEEVFVKGSEVINTWEDNGDNTWKVTLPSSFFNGYNPYELRVDGDFQNYGQWHHRGDIYINNGVLNELQTLDQTKEEPYSWYTTTEGSETILYANFGKEDPNTALTEINVRELIFYTSALDIDYITIDGLRFLHAAPNWQAPNEGDSDPNPLTQKGAVGSKMGKGWIIENCEVSYSKTAGIMMGESFDDQGSFEDITAFGDHVIRNNIITRCGQYGIAGQKGMTRSAIKGNRIEDINFRNEFGGYEPAGIKIWNCVDVLIENNLIRNVIATQSDESQAYCIWIDFANQGTRITRNFLVGSPMTTTALFLEANIGPTLVDNNIIIDRTDKAIFVFSGGSVFAHNLFVNSNFSFAIQQFGNGGSGARNAYTLKPHTLKQTNNGQKVEIEYNQMYNNIFAGGSGPVNFSADSGAGNVVDYNLYIGGTNPATAHTHAFTSMFNFSYKITDTETGIDFSFEFDDSFKNITSPYVNEALVGVIPFANQSIADEEGNPITVNRDFNLLDRVGTHPKIGPLENISVGTNSIRIGSQMLATPGTKYPVPVSVPPAEPQAPFQGKASDIPGVIEAENYDLGGQGISYSDNTTKDGDPALRAGDNVDLGSGPDNGVVVGWFDNDEWLEYTVDIDAGTYKMNVSAASALEVVGDLKVSINDQEIATVDVSGTSDWNVYKTFSVNNITLGAAINAILRVTSTGGFNLDRFSFFKNSITSIDNTEGFSSRIYPNPVQDVLNVELKSGSDPLLKIYSIVGDILLTKRSNSIDLSSLAGGTYILMVNDLMATRIIKK
ncbi:carbohydrate-binding protein [Fulvivirga sp. M361]|uniref:carbohydrate-binding protein n=1 Tax=Fulvivirga sp. M361 TaxID=2594266 RepID=UPI00117B8F8D|nr:carbohydrate-binding protein [Fulvivirga sp. M361]TRX58248.1 carbohydrate-binding protein [Fulvivirga sp. M361]